MKRRLVLPAIAAVSLLASGAQAAKILTSVTAELMDGYAQIVVARVVERLPDDRIRLAIVKTLYGTDQGAVDVLVDSETHGAVAAGRQYLVGYSRVRKNPLLRDVREEDPRGPVAVATTLVGDFVLPDQPAARRLIRGPLGQGGSARAQAKAALALLARDDVASIRFAVMELYGREDLRGAVDGPMVERLAAHLRDSTFDPLAKEFLFRAAGRMMAKQPSRDHAWLRDSARHVLAALDRPFDPVSPMPSLAVTAMDALAATGTKEDACELASLVASGHPGVAKGALRAMDRLDRAYTLERARAWLAASSSRNEPNLLEETVRALRAYVARHGEGARHEE